MSETVEPGKWYFHVICHSCERAISLMEDPSQGRNPRTGEPIQIPASRQAKFKAGKGLKQSLN